MSKWESRCRPGLLDLLRRDPDCELVFTGLGDAGGQEARVPAHSLVIKLHSTPLRHALEASHDKPFQLRFEGGTELDGWLETLHLLYQSNGSVGLSLTSVAHVLPIAHKYNMRSLLDDCCKWIKNNLDKFTATPGEGYVLRWLRMAEQYEFYDLKATVLLAFRQVLSRHDAARTAAMLADVASLSQLQSGTLARMMGQVPEGGPLYGCSECAECRFRMYGTVPAMLYCNHAKASTVVALDM